MSYVRRPSRSAKGRLEQTAQHRVDHVVTDAEHPAALFEAAGRVLGRTAGALNHAVQRNKNSARKLTH